MAEARFAFRCLHTDGSCAARRGELVTPHGAVDLPAFMPVGTRGTVKGLTSDMVRGTGAQMVLGNTYHLTLRPGPDVVAHLGGLHRFMGWHGPILTDSGGFQLFSLATHTQVREEGALFRSHIDGSSAGVVAGTGGRDPGSVGVRYRDGIGPRHSAAG